MATKKEVMKSNLKTTVKSADKTALDRFEVADQVMESFGIASKQAKGIPERGTSVKRETFSFPEEDYALIRRLQLLAAKKVDGLIHRSEAVRAALRVAMEAEEEYLKVVVELERLKRGRK